MFTDHDNQTNAAAAATAPEAETTPNSTHAETNSPVENTAEQITPAAAAKSSETASAGQETPSAGAPERTGASTDEFVSACVLFGVVSASGAVAAAAALVWLSWSVN